MVKVTQHSWLGGILDRELMGRQDIDRYASGASEIVNFLPQRRGSLAKRPGTDRVADLTDNGGFLPVGAPFRMIPFSYKADDGRVLIIKSGAMHVYKADGTSFNVSGTIPAYTADELNALCPAQCGDIIYLASQNHPPAMVKHNKDLTYSFEEVTFNPQPDKPWITSYYLDRKYFSPENWVEIKNKGQPNEHIGNVYDVWESGHEQSDGNSYRPAYDSGIAEAYYAASVVDEDGNESTLAAVSRNATGDIEGEDKPSFVETENSGLITGSKTGLGAHILGVRYYTPWTESQTIKVSVRAKVPVGKKIKEIRLYKDIAGTYGLVGIAAEHLCEHQTFTPQDKPAYERYTYEFVDDNIQPDTSNSPLSDKTVFDKGTQENPNTDDFPGAVAVYQQRLVWASTKNDPARVWMSATGDLHQHRPHVTIEPDDPIDFILPITRFAKINFIVELRKLLMFSEACEWLVSSNSASEGLSYDTIQATPHSYIGCNPRLPPIVANANVLFAERTGKAVRSYGYQLEDDGYGGTDISVFSASIFDGRKIVDWTYQQHPQPTVWCVLDDGSLASCVYMPEQQVCAWARHELGGGGKAKAIACNWALEGDTSTVMLVAERGTAMMLERFRRQPGPHASVADAVCLDYAHVVAADAAVPPGRIALPLPDGEHKIVGFPFRSSFTSVYPAISEDRIGAAQFDVRVVQDVALRLRMGVGGRVRAAQAPANLAAPLVVTVCPEADTNGKMSFPQVDERVVLAGVNDGDGRVVVEQDDPWPFEIVLMESDIDVEVPSED